MSSHQLVVRSQRRHVKTLPKEFECLVDGALLPIDKFSQNQISKWVKHKQGIGLICKDHARSEQREIKCHGPCDKIKLKMHFSKIQRNELEPWCIVCTDWKTRYSDGKDAPIVPPGGARICHAISEAITDDGSEEDMDEHGSVPVQESQQYINNQHSNGTHETGSSSLSGDGLWLLQGANFNSDDDDDDNRGGGDTDGDPVVEGINLSSVQVIPPSSPAEQQSTNFYSLYGWEMPDGQNHQHDSRDHTQEGSSSSHNSSNGNYNHDSSLDDPSHVNLRSTEAVQVGPNITPKTQIGSRGTISYGRSKWYKGDTRKVFLAEPEYAAYSEDRPVIRDPNWSSDDDF